MDRRGVRYFLSALLCLYVVARVGQAVPDRVPILLTVAAHVLLPLIFAMIHGAAIYRLRGALAFAGFCFVIGNAIENLGVATGFPFGRYYFTDAMGPKLFHVPIMLALAYIGMGYLSWTLGGLILGNPRESMAGSLVFTRPIVAAFLMLAWDLSMDPIWANLVGAWVWRDGGAYFGVPLSNFFGWYLTVYLIFQAFALYVRRNPCDGAPLDIAFWRLPVLFYAVSAAGNFLVLQPPGVSIVTDAAGEKWSVAGIFGASKLVSVFVMGAFAVFAWIRSSEANKKPTFN